MCKPLLITYWIFSLNKLTKINIFILAGNFSATELRRAVFDDPCTTSDELLNLAMMCEKFGYREASLELTAASAVLIAVTGARTNNDQT